MDTKSNFPYRHTAGRLLQALAIGKGNPGVALSFAESQGAWNDRSLVVSALKSAVGAIGTADYGSPPPVAESFMAAMRDFSVPLRLAGLNQVPMRTRVYVNGSGVLSVRVAEGAAIPVLRGSWTASQLNPIKHAGIAVVTQELIESMSATATASMLDDLAKSTAEAENYSFLNPDAPDSVLNGASNFAGTGTSVANIDADIKRVLDLVPGAKAWTMTKETATFLSLVRGSGGSRAYPDITVDGGMLQGLPVLVTKACALNGSPPTRIIGVLSPSEIVWADEGIVRLSTSQDAMLEMSDAPTGDALAPTASGGMVSMFQADSVALKAVRESSWYARSGAGAYFTAGY